MFNIKLIEELKGGDNEGAGVYGNFEQWRINVNLIVIDMKDQGLFPRQYYKKPNTID
jgi:hypothetical protein